VVAADTEKHGVCRGRRPATIQATYGHVHVLPQAEGNHDQLERAQKQREPGARVRFAKQEMTGIEQE